MTTGPVVCYVGGFCLTTEYQLFLMRDYYRLAYFNTFYGFFKMGIMEQYEKCRNH